jgi:WD40 repeat protein
MRKLQTTFVFVILFYLQINGQYFGRNKVQYETFDWNEMYVNNFKVLYYPPESLAVSDASRMLLRWNQRLQSVFDWNLPADQPFIFYANHADFQQTNAIPGVIPQSVGGVTEGLMNRVIIPLTGVYSENDHVIGHELAHAYHYAIMRRLGGLSQSQPLALWFIEGMSEYLSIGPRSPLTAMWMRDALLYDYLPTISEVSQNPRYFPYRYGHAIWAYVGGIWGDKVISDLMRSSVRMGTSRAIQKVLGVSQTTLSNQWQQATRQAFGSLIDKKTTPENTGKLLIKESEINLAPVISPDGKWVAFISSRNLFTIDLFLADAKTGNIIKQLTSSLSDQHFDALRFFNSSGTWSPDAKRFAFTVFKEGDNAISIIDVPSGDVVRSFNLTNVGEITQLAWSPDGRYIAASATSKAISDIYIYDLVENTTNNLTNDLYAQLQPTWSPDGKLIAYVTDQSPLTDFYSMQYANMRIGIYNVENGTRNFINVANWATHIDPQFSSSGNELFFVANPEGISNIFRYSFKTGQSYRITNIATGITGLTNLSPAMSYAAKTGEMVFTVFSRQNYHIRKMVPDTGTLFTADSNVFISTISLPPQAPENSIIFDYLQNPTVKPPDTVIIKDYSPSLKLFYIGQILGGLSVNRYGLSAGGGISVLFSDLLGNHLLGIGAQISGGILDFGGEIFYLKQNRRTNWGIGISHFPDLSISTQNGTDTIINNGETSQENSLTVIKRRVFEDRIRAWLEYPFSLNRRLEIGASYIHLSYNFEGEIQRGINGQLISQSSFDVSEPSSLDFFRSSFAFVGYYSFFGMTSPVIGRKYRLEVEPTIGSLNYLSALADYRHYFFIQPLTLAFRLLFNGRYFGDAENERLAPLFLGYQNLVRGYSIYSIDRRGCSIENNFENCPEVNRLFGSSITVFNVELRIPLFGPPQLALIDFSFIPLELVAFADAGAAWNSNNLPQLDFTTETAERIPVFSIGGAVRINLFNAFVLQLYLAYPFQRSDTNFDLGLVISPGW